MEIPPPGMPPELRAFLNSCIDSGQQLDILLLLQRSERPWTARAISLESGSGSAARTHLETLAARGLLKVGMGEEVTYQYAPQSAELRRYADQLADYFVHSPTQILRSIASPPKFSVRRSAEAFKLRDSE